MHYTDRYIQKMCVPLIISWITPMLITSQGQFPWMTAQDLVPLGAKAYATSMRHEVIHMESKDYFVHAPSQSQWGMMLQCNVSHWLDACTRWSLGKHIFFKAGSPNIPMQTICDPYKRNYSKICCCKHNATFISIIWHFDFKICQYKQCYTY